jgi:hypothetical protein
MNPLATLLTISAKIVEELSESKLQVVLSDLNGLPRCIYICPTYFNIGDHSTPPLSPRMEAEQRLLDLCMKLLDDGSETSKSRKETLITGNNNVVIC